MSFSKLAINYFIGSFGAAICVVAFYLIDQTKFTGFTVLTANLNFESFYAPVFWGGICGFLYLIPLKISSFIKSIVFSLPPAFIYLSLERGGLSSIVDYIQPEILFRQDVFMVLIIYIFCWGVLGSKIAQKYS